MQRAERVEFVSDENGWEMHVTTEDGFVRRFNVQGVTFELMENLNNTIGSWYREGLRGQLLEPSIWRRESEVDYDLAREMAQEQRLELDD